MNSYADKTTEQPKAIADNAMRSSLVNNRPEALAMQNLQDSASSSAQVQQLKTYQSMADQAMAQRQAITGDSNKPIQLKTKIQHTTGTVEANGGNYTVGVDMKARLDPKDPVQGSATGLNSAWMQWIRKQYPKANVVRGHLLNHDLGGFGIEENLFPISTLANANHSSKVEQNVKGELTKLNSEVKNKDEGYIQYHVSVNQIKGYEEAQFVCKWGVNKNNKLEELGEETIDSKLAKDTGGFGGGKKGKHSPASWQHGRSKGGTEVKPVRDRLKKATDSGNIFFSSKPTDHKGGFASSDQDYIEYLFEWVEDEGSKAVYEALKVMSVDKSLNADKLGAVKEMMKILYEENTWN